MSSVHIPLFYLIRYLEVVLFFVMDTHIWQIFSCIWSLIGNNTTSVNITVRVCVFQKI